MYGLCIVFIYLPALYCSVLAANFKFFLTVCMLTTSKKLKKNKQKNAMSIKMFPLLKNILV